MNKKMLFCCTVLIILLFVMVIVACTPDSKTDCEITSATGFTINETTLSIKVPNQQDSFSFSNSITVSQNANWYVSTDIEGNNQIPSGTVSLQVGDNIFYINITSGNGSSKKQYTANIRRREIYTVTYEPNNGEQSIVLKIEEDGKINNQTVEKHGFTLDGWLYGDKFWDFENDTIKNNTVLTAAWSGKQYTVSFDTNVEENIPSVEVTCGNLYQFETVEKEHYQFLGWAYNNIMLTDENGNSLSKWFISDNITVTACWEPIKYQLCYDNVFEAENANPQYYTIESENIHLLTPYRLGYDFIGWTENDEFIYDIPSGTYGDKILIANWEEINYTISYENIDNAINDNPTIYNINSNIIILNQAERAGYDFLGWFDDGDNQVIEIPTGTYGNIKLSAKWEMIVYNVTYHLDGGINSASNIVNYSINTLGGENEAIELYSPTKESIITDIETNGNGQFSVTRDVYFFTGWFLDNQFIDSVNYITLGVKELYAKWETSSTTTTEEIYTIENDKVLFGSYPQSLVTDTSILSALGGYEDNSWNDYDYHCSGVTNFMYYCDKIYNNEKYRGVFFTEYRAINTLETSSIENSYQDDNGYFTSTVYWFRYEPIKWNLINNNNGKITLVSDLILDSQNFDYDATLSNIYSESTIRSWLNNSFYSTAFDEIQQKIIETHETDNSVNSTEDDINPNTSENTYDKVFLMSAFEANTWFNSNTERIRRGTDYSKCQGLYVNETTSFQGNSSYLLRSPNSTYSLLTKIVTYSGQNLYSAGITDTYYGIVPVIVLQS